MNTITSLRHAGIQTAEALMRSRYDAYARLDVDYLLATWHPSTRPAELELDPELVWRGLRIIETVRGGESDDDGIVEFLAAYMDQGQRGQLRERSRFVREDGLWLYVDGEIAED